MPVDFDVVGWEDWAGDRHDGPPRDVDLPEVMGMFVHSWDDDTGQEGYHWNFIYPPAYDDWSDWWFDIYGSLEGYGYDI